MKRKKKFTPAKRSVTCETVTSEKRTHSPWCTLYSVSNIDMLATNACIHTYTHTERDTHTDHRHTHRERHTHCHAAMLPHNPACRATYSSSYAHPQLRTTPCQTHSATQSRAEPWMHLHIYGATSGRVGGRADERAGCGGGGRADGRTDRRAGGRAGGRADGQVGGRAGGQTDGRTDRRKEGRTDGRTKRWTTAARSTMTPS